MRRECDRLLAKKLYHLLMKKESHHTQLYSLSNQHSYVTITYKHTGVFLPSWQKEQLFVYFRYTIW